MGREREGTKSRESHLETKEHNICLKVRLTQIKREGPHLKTK
jgi:hypothetical protein